MEAAWYLLANEDSAQFIYGIAKRARKYYLGLTTITQDVDDFLGSEYGKAIVTNSSIQVLLKQHPAAIDRVAETFYLSEGEKSLLLAADRGEGLFFAGSNHVAIKVEASDEEHEVVTTNPAEILKLREKGTLKEEPQKPTYQPVAMPKPPAQTPQPEEQKPEAEETPPTPKPAPPPPEPETPKPQEEKPAPPPEPPGWSGPLVPGRSLQRNHQNEFRTGHLLSGVRAWSAPLPYVQPLPMLQ